MNLCLIIISFLSTYNALVIYESTKSIDEISGVSGLQYIPNNDQLNINWKNHSFTICLRINYKRLGKESRILALANPESSTPFLWLPAQYPSTVFPLT